MSRSKNPSAYAHVAASAFLFSGIPEKEIAELLSRDGVTVRHFAAGERIRSRTDTANCLGILLFGSATVEKRRGDERMLMSILSGGDLFGAAAMFGSHDTYVADITATKSSWALLIPEEALRGMMRTDYRVAENYLTYLTARIRFLSGRIDSFAGGSVPDRLLLFLTDNAVDGKFCPEYPLSALADALCISRATLYRALDALIARGAITKDKKTIIIMEDETI